MFDFYLTPKEPKLPIQKEAGFRISSDPSQWERDVLSQLHEQHPYIPDSDIDIALNRADEESGSGIGQVTINQKASIPFVIKNFTLQPFDIIMSSGKMHPFTRRALEGLSVPTSMGEPVSPPESGTDQGLRNAIVPPHYGKYALAHVLQYTEDDLRTAVERVTTEDGLVYDINNSPILVEGLSTYVRNVKPRGIVKEASVPTLRPIESKYHRVTSGPAAVLTGAGAKVGVLFDKVAALAEGTSKKLFLAADGSYAFVDGAVAGTNPSPTQFATQEKLAGRGVFHRINNGVPECTEPVRVIAKNQVGYLVETDLGNKLTIQKHADFDGLEVIENSVFLSSDWKFSQLNRRVDLVSWETYNDHRPSGDIKLIKAGGVVICKGNLSKVPGLSRLADGVPYDRIVTEYGRLASLENLNVVREHLDRDHEARLTVYDITKEASEKLKAPQVDETTLACLFKCAAYLTPSVTEFLNKNFNFITKLGVQMPAAEDTVDAALGLNFLTDSNVRQFLDNIGTFEDCRTLLAQLLLGSRLGLAINPQVVRAALFGLDTVISQLKSLRTTAE